MKTINALIFTTASLLVFATSAQACGGGDDAHPVLEIGSKVLLEDAPAIKVFEQYPASPIPHLSKKKKKGIKLNELIPSSYSSGKVVIYSCGKQFMKSFADLRSNNPELSNYYITYTKRKSLKLIHAKSTTQKGRPILKRLVHIQVLPDS